MSGRHIYAGGSEEPTITRRDLLKSSVAAVRSDNMKEALQVAADRSAITSAIDFP